MQFVQLLQSQGLRLVQTWLGRAQRLPAPVEWASGSQVTSVPESTHILVLSGPRGRSSWRRQPPSLGSLFLAFFFGRLHFLGHKFSIFCSLPLFFSVHCSLRVIYWCLCCRHVKYRHWLLCALESDTTEHTRRRTGRGVTTVSGFRGCFSVKSDVSGF